MPWVKKSKENFFYYSAPLFYRVRVIPNSEISGTYRVPDGYPVHPNAFVQSIVDAALGQWRRRLSACVRGVGHTLSTKHKVSAILLCIYQKLLNWWKYDKVDRK